MTHHCVQNFVDVVVHPKIVFCPLSGFRPFLSPTERSIFSLSEKKGPAVSNTLISRKTECKYWPHTLRWSYWTVIVFTRNVLVPALWLCAIMVLSHLVPEERANELDIELKGSSLSFPLWMNNVLSFFFFLVNF